MMRRLRRAPFLLVASAVLLAACADDPIALTPDDLGTDAAEDVGASDLGSDALGDTAEDVVSDAPQDVADSGDGAEPDAAPDADVGTDTPGDPDAIDLDTEDATSDVPDEEVGPVSGFGAISGSCGVIGEELDDERSSFFEAVIDFGDDPFDDPDDQDSLTPGGLAVLEAGNSGGSSLYSEVFAFEVLARCDSASLLETERTIEYEPEHSGSITDLLVLIDGEQVGVSVTRAVGFPRDEPYTVERAADLLAGKLEDILESSAGVAEEDAWVKQVLFVIAYADGHVESLRAAVETVDAEIRADTVIFVVESEGMDEWLY